MTKSNLSKVNVVSTPQPSLGELISCELFSDDWSEQEKNIDPMNRSSVRCLVVISCFYSPK